VTRRYEADSFEAPDRFFQILQAARLHNQVWLQSDRPSENMYRLEVLFPGVDYLCMPFYVRDLHLRRATADERKRLTALHDVTVGRDRDVYLLSPGHDWFVVSGNPVWAEADLSWNDPPVFYHQYSPDVVISLGEMSSEK
jgi:hypothetical protein